MKKIAIIGGGIGGLCAAIALQQKGFEVHVYEKAPQLKALGAGITISVNAVKGLATLGLDHKLLEAGYPLKNMYVLDEKGRKLAHTYLPPLEKKYGAFNFSIHRAALHKVLIQDLQAGTLHLNKSFTGVEQNSDSVKISFADGSQSEADLLIAYDGIHSAVREQLMPTVKPRYAGYTCWRAVIDYVPEVIGEHQASETWGPKGRFGIVPLAKHKLYWYATVNAPEGSSAMKNLSAKDLIAHFVNYHTPITDILEHSRDEQIILNDIIDLKPIPQYTFGKIVLAGDAAHATTPNMGQGACMAIEDAIILANLLKKFEVDEALAEFEKRRITRTHKIVKNSSMLGKVSQWEHGAAIYLRNLLLRATPAYIQSKQLEALYRVDLS
ncbi:FAD-dependent monooxygenase [Porifericola rhodea]|uniref:FAD-dependent monooxygenase n=1 Tax=Porifericola rhodea TaxID=930972 RepID=UPI0026650BCE|nr:FAD-dependent monooxygenase [Porifericola rhodea]WKN33578.1 FAD-dependent monooxygenase [Porifericola rhodea]